MSGTPQSFVPPHCPIPPCRYHRSAVGWRWTRFGTYTRQCAPQAIQRFRCCHCGRTFSNQTISTTYYLKRPALQELLAHRLLTCAGYRQMTREAGCTHSTLMGQAARLGRHALLLLSQHRPQVKVRRDRLVPLVVHPCAPSLFARRKGYG